MLETLVYELRLTSYFNPAECPRSAISELYRRIKYLVNCRQVGVCLKHLPSFSADTNHHFHNANVPWQRVINAKGIISPRSVVRSQEIYRTTVDMSHRGPGGATRQAAFLRREGVTVETGNLGELVIDLEVYGWFPDFLPSKGAEASDSESEEEEGSS